MAKENKPILREGSYVRLGDSVCKVVGAPMQVEDARKFYKAFDSKGIMRKSLSGDYCVVKDAKGCHTVQVSSLSPYNISDDLDDYNLGYLVGVMSATQGIPEEMAAQSMLVDVDGEFTNGVGNAYTELGAEGIIPDIEEPTTPEDGPIELEDHDDKVVVDQPFHYELPAYEVMPDADNGVNILADMYYNMSQDVYAAINKIGADNSVQISSFKVYTTEEAAKFARDSTSFDFSEVGHLPVPAGGKMYAVIEGNYAVVDFDPTIQMTDSVKKVLDATQYNKMEFSTPGAINTFLQANPEYFYAGRDAKGYFLADLDQMAAMNLEDSEDVKREEMVAEGDGFVYFDGDQIVFSPVEDQVILAIHNDEGFGTYLEVKEGDDISVQALPYDDYVEEEDDDTKFTNYMTIWRVNGERDTQHRTADGKKL